MQWHIQPVRHDGKWDRSPFDNE